MKRKASLILLILLTLVHPTFAQDDAWKKYTSVGGQALQRGRVEEAERNFRMALKEAEKSGAQDRRLAQSLHNVGLTSKMQGRFGEAEKLFMRSLNVYRSIQAAEDEVAFELWNLGQLYMKVDKNDAALPMLEQALALAEKSKGPEDLLVANILGSMAEVYFKEHKYVQAEPFYLRALKIYEKSLGAEHWTVAGILEEYASLLKKMKRKDEASEAEKRAQKIRTNNKTREPFRIPS